MIIENAKSVPGPKPRLRRFYPHDGREFYGKGTLCPKRNGEHNPTWLANEIIYTVFARACGLPVPATDIFRHDDRQLYFGSEKVAGRKPLNEVDQYVALFTDQENRKRLTRAALLDLALLNSDRTAGNTLGDANRLLWFYDHDKSLLGDGRRPEKTQDGKQGDLGRLNATTVDDAFNNYLGDYIFLRFPEAINPVFADQPWARVQEEFGRLTLERDLLMEGRAALPDPSWLSESLYEKMATFLSVWWQSLRIYFESQPNADNLLLVLRKRQVEREERKRSRDRR